MRLSAGQLAQYETNGFLAIERLVDDGTVAALRDAYDEILAGGEDGERMLGGITRQVMIPSGLHPLYKRNPALDAAREVVAPLLDNPTFLFDMLIYKPPNRSADRTRRAYIFNFISESGLARVLAERRN